MANDSAVVKAIDRVRKEADFGFAGFYKRKEIEHYNQRIDNCIALFTRLRRIFRANTAVIRTKL